MDARQCVGATPGSDVLLPSTFHLSHLCLRSSLLLSTCLSTLHHPLPSSCLCCAQMWSFACELVPLGEVLEDLVQQRNQRQASVPRQVLEQARVGHSERAQEALSVRLLQRVSVRRRVEVRLEALLQAVPLAHQQLELSAQNRRAASAQPQASVPRQALGLLRQVLADSGRRPQAACLERHSLLLHPCNKSFRRYSRKQQSRAGWPMCRPTLTAT